jgi:serine/threonine-protein kinase RsbW
LEDLDLDAVADLRLALDEACTRLIRSAAPDSTVVVEVEPRETDLRITVSTTCVGDDILRAGTFSWHVISSLTDDVQTFRRGPDHHPGPGGVFGITMIARRLEADR